MTEKKSRRLWLEILGIFAVCFAISIVLYLFLSFFTVAIVEEICFQSDITLSEDQLHELDATVLVGALVVSVIFFAVLFFALFGERLAYIRTIISGVDALQRGELDHTVPLRGRNELTELAGSVNYLAATEKEIKQKEQKLAEEKEELIRALSHDIRTPLTSIMSYTELLANKKDLTPEELARYFELVGSKTAQIKHLTDILLDAGKRELESFEEASVLFMQLADEFEESLESDFKVETDLSALSHFAGSFDVREMQRVFDNLISNVQKYADPAAPVTLRISHGEQGIVLTQKNAVRAPQAPTESYRMGIHSVRRIAQNYGGSTDVRQTEQDFEITITLSNI